MSTGLETVVKRTLCPYCTFGCELGIVFDDFGVKGVEYLADSPNHGRLCPRGSGSAMLLNHRRRLCVPVKDGQQISWDRAVKELKRLVEHPDSAAVTFDRNLTLEEYRLLIGWCREVGIKMCASSYGESDQFLRRFAPSAPLDETLKDAQVVVVVGDPFSFAPMTSHPLINWKLADRKRRLIVIDSVATHTSSFANDFLRTRVGAEPLVLLALAGEKLEGVDLPDVTGVADEVLRSVQTHCRGASKAAIVACCATGHTYDPALLAEAIARLSQSLGIPVVPYLGWIGNDGTADMAAVLAGVKSKKIKHVLNFGELFPVYYPQVARDIKHASIIATAILRHDEHLLLPVPLDQEKSGTIALTGGTGVLEGGIKPASGTRSIEEILKMMGASPAAAKQDLRNPVKLDLKRAVGDLIERLRKPRKPKSYLLIGEQIAYYYRGLFAPDVIKINPIDADTMDLNAKGMIKIKSGHAAVDLGYCVTQDVPAGVVATTGGSAVARDLFGYNTDYGIVNLVPTEVELWANE